MGDPIIWRGIERLLIALGGIVFAYLGYRLYVQGITRGRGEAQVKSPILQFALSGTGPGLFFMAFGAIVLSISLSTGGSSTTVTEDIIDNTTEQVIRRLTTERVQLSDPIDLEVEFWTKIDELNSRLSRNEDLIMDLKQRLELLQAN